MASTTSTSLWHITHYSNYIIYGLLQLTTALSLFPEFTDVLMPVMTSFIILLSTMYLQRVYMVTNNNAARVATHDVGHRGCAQRHQLVRCRYSAWWQRMLRLVLHTVSAMLGIDAAATALLHWRCCITSVLCR
jgi:hypothetical protein